jgi:hypothetical protein
MTDLQAFSDWLDVELKVAVDMLLEPPYEPERLRAAADAISELNTAAQMLDLYRSTIGARETA